ncbi:MAG: hypothetical protein QXU40_01035 [Candidatus Pacearchaeota archaeon]
MTEKITKEEAERKIISFFEKIGEKRPEEIRKIKRLAEKYQIKLRKNKRYFCKKCFMPYIKTGSKIRIKNKTKIIICGYCNYITRFKIS